MFLKVKAQTTVSIASNAYSNQTLTPTIPEGYTLICASGYALNNLYAMVYNTYINDNNTIGIGVKNLASTNNSVTINVYGLCVKTVFI